EAVAGAPGPGDVGGERAATDGDEAPVQGCQEEAPEGPVRLPGEEQRADEVRPVPGVRLPDSVGGATGGMAALRQGADGEGGDALDEGGRPGDAGRPQ